MSRISKSNNWGKSLPFVLVFIFCVMSCQEKQEKCPDASVGKIRFRVAGHACKTDTETDADAMAKAGKDLLENAYKACKEGSAKNCEDAGCDDTNRRCTIQPDLGEIMSVPVENDPDCGGGKGYVAYPKKRTDAAGDYYIDCECNCTPKR